MISHPRRLVPALGLLVLATAACSAPRTADPSAAPSLAGVPATIAPGDRLEVEVWGDTAATRVEADVDGRGMITLPRVGEVPVGGLEADNARDLVRSRFAEFLTETPVGVRHLRRVSVQGEVQEPGVFWLDATVTLRELLAFAGGLLETGDPDRIFLQRGSALVPLRSDVPGMLPPIPLASGDQLVVRRRSWLSLNVPYLVSSAVGLAGVVAAFIAGTR